MASGMTPGSLATTVPWLTECTCDLERVRIGDQVILVLAPTPGCEFHEIPNGTADTYVPDWVTLMDK